MNPIVKEVLDRRPVTPTAVILLTIYAVAKTLLIVLTVLSVLSGLTAAWELGLAIGDRLV